VGEVLDGVEFRDVADDAVCLRTACPQSFDGLIERRLIDVGKHDARAATRELPRTGKADAARTAGDYRSASLECLHGAKTISLGDGVNRRTAVEVDECRGVPLRQRDA